MNIDDFPFPELIDNIPQLDQINYRLGQYTNIRSRIFRELDLNEDLNDWTYRGSDDPGIAIVEATAIIADILLLYQNVYANQIYLRSSSWETAVNDIVKITGYKPTPGMGGYAYFAMLIKDKESLFIPKGTGIKTQLVEIDDQGYFETSQDCQLDQRLNNLKIYQKLRTANKLSTNSSFYFHNSQSLELRENDRIVIFDANQNTNLYSNRPTEISMHSNTIIATISKVEVLEHKTFISFKGEIPQSFIDYYNNTKTLHAYKIRTKYRHFGYNAPTQILRVPENQSDPNKPVSYHLDLSFQRNLGSSTYSEEDKFDSTSNLSDIKHLIFSPTLKGNEYWLEYEVDITNGELILLEFNFPIQEEKNGETTSDKKVKRSRRKKRVRAKVFEEIGYQETTRSTIRTLLQANRGVPELKEINNNDTKNNVTISESVIEPYSYYTIGKVKLTSSVNPKWGDFSLPTTSLILQQTLGQQLTVCDIRNITLNVLEGEPIQLFNGNLVYDSLQGTSNDLISESTFLIEWPHERINQLFNLRIYFKTSDTGQFRVITNVIKATQSTFRENKESTYYLIELDDTIEIDSYVGNISGYTKGITLFDEEYLVYGNIVFSSQGKTEKDIVLGSGDNRLSFQTFSLPDYPLTYLNIKDATPPEVPQIEIYINNILWKHVQSFYGMSKDDEVYVIINDHQNSKIYIQFGDGRTGARLPSGINNIVCTYRIGCGANGELKPKTNPTIDGNYPEIDEIALLDIIYGGSETETPESVKISAPGQTIALDRLVSMEDYNVLINSFPTILKSNVYLSLDDHNNSIINIAVLLDATQTEAFSLIEEAIYNYDKYHGPQRYTLNITQCYFKYLQISLSYSKFESFRSDVIEPEIRRQLGSFFDVPEEQLSFGDGLFSLKIRKFGQSEHLTKLLGIIQNIEGVSAIKIDYIAKYTGEINDYKQIPLYQKNLSNVIPLDPADWIVITNNSDLKIVTCGRDEILQLYDTHLNITHVEVI